MLRILKVIGIEPVEFFRELYHHRHLGFFHLSVAPPSACGARLARAFSRPFLPAWMQGTADDQAELSPLVGRGCQAQRPWEGL